MQTEKTYYDIETIKIRLTCAEAVKSKCTEPEEVTKILRPIFQELDADQEHFVMLALDRMNNVNGYKVLFSGGQSFAQVDVALVFRSALLLGACRIIVAHNHPSGSKDPSTEDRVITQKIKEAGALLGIKLLDHIIIAGSGHYSFLEAGSL